ncbi:MAG: DUF459 domain-containing protein [Actinobacteria bacterium]|nr:DUF459 domain-containing protein [Actinomycetota bacterium]
MDEQPSKDRLTHDASGLTPGERAAARARRRQQLRRRRLVALGALAAIVILLIVLVSLAVRGCGGDGSAGASAGKPSPKPTELRTPTAADPLRLGAYGESVGGGMLLGLKLLTEGRKDIAVHRFVKVASGLTRPDFFDWPAYLKQDIDKRKRPFDAVALMFGANDGQDTKVDGKQLIFGSGSWKAMYAQRVGAVMDLYLERGVKRVCWVGMPRMGIGWFNKRMELMNGIYKAEAAKRAPQVEYIDAWTIVDAPADTYQAKYRQTDGVHMTVEGGLKTAQAVLDVIAPEWHMPPFK